MNVVLAAVRIIVIDDDFDVIDVCKNRSLDARARVRARARLPRPRAATSVASKIGTFPLLNSRNILN